MAKLYFFPGKFCSTKQSVRRVEVSPTLLKGISLGRPGPVLPQVGLNTKLGDDNTSPGVLAPGMSTLLPVLAAISLLDSTTIIPICIIPLAAILGGRRPILGAAGFLAGVFLVYAGIGLLLLIGFDALFDALGPSVSRWWNNPNTPELLLQLVVGGVMLGFGWRLAKVRQSRARRDVRGAISPGRGFVLGAGLTLVSMPGAFPYFGAIDQIGGHKVGHSLQVR